VADSRYSIADPPPEMSYAVDDTDSESPREGTSRGQAVTVRGLAGRGLGI
jgi:hypothetical protein